MYILINIYFSFLCGRIFDYFLMSLLISMRLFVDWIIFVSRCLYFIIAWLSLLSILFGQRSAFW